MVREALTGYWTLVSGLTEVTVERARTVARAMVAQGEATREQVTGLAQEITEASRVNREALLDLVRYETERAAGRLGFASTDELTLDPGSSEPSAVDTFSLQLGELGEVNRLRVRHDDAGLGRAWYLDRIAIRNEESGREWTFPCNRWLARHEDDGEIERTLDAMRTRSQPRDENAQR